MTDYQFLKLNGITPDVLFPSREHLLATMQKVDAEPAERVNDSLAESETKVLRDALLHEGDRLTAALNKIDRLTLWLAVLSLGGLLVGFWLGWWLR